MCVCIYKQAQNDVKLRMSINVYKGTEPMHNICRKNKKEQERTRKNIKKKCVASEHKYRVNQNDCSIEYFSNISVQINHKIYTRLSMKNPIELLDDFL